MEDGRAALPFEARGVEAKWALSGIAEVELLRLKVRFVGVSLARVVHELASSLRRGAMSEPGGGWPIDPLGCGAADLGAARPRRSRGSA